MQVSRYTIHSRKAAEKDIECRIALVADLHDRDPKDLIPKIRDTAPDMIAVVGDLMDAGGDRVARPEQSRHALEFLAAAAKIAPTFYSLGNHEFTLDENGDPISFKAVEDTGTVLLDDRYVDHCGMWVGGLTSAYSRSHVLGDRPFQPDTTWLEEFQHLPGLKILLCHHPEYYPRYVQDLDIDIMLSGHAHGGQWRIFGQGVFAPGQGLFPKYTSGVYDDRLVVSKGLANTAMVPRIGDPKELLILDIKK